MLGFTGSSISKLNHREELLSKVPVKYHSEIEQVYDWSLDSSFDSAHAYNTKEQWEYCKKVMTNPPVIFISRRQLLAPVHKKLEVEYPKVRAEAAMCRLCDENFSLKECVISCHCTRMYCHKSCAETYLSKEDKCYVCKQYYVYESFNSTIHDCKSSTGMGARWGNMPISSLQ